MRHASRLSLPTLAILAAWTGGASAAQIPADTHITAVTVYTDRATVTREAEVELPAGASILTIDKLPASITANSLRAEASATEAVTLGALDSKLVSSRDLAVARERDLDARLQALNDQMAMLHADQQANEGRITFLHKLGEHADDVSNENFAHLDLKPDQWTAAATTLYNSLSDALKIQAANNVKQRDINKEVQQLNAELSSVQTGERSTMSVSIPLDAPHATKLTLRLTYQLPNATWQPVYDARLVTATGKLSLIEFGEVTQSTGEDWSDVALTLSTAQPAEGAAPPHIFPQLVDIDDGSRPSASALKEKYEKAIEEQNGRKLAQAQASGKNYLGGAQMDAAAPAPPPQQEAQFRIAEFDTGGFVTEYKIAGPATAKADSSANRVMIGKLDTAATQLDQVRPALNPHAFLMARVKIGGDSPLLPGDANLFRDGVFIGSETMPFMRPGQESTLAFGVDDQIVVKRQTIADVEGTSGVLTKNQTLERRVSTSIENLHKMPVKLEVLEAVPVPRNEAIKLEIIPDATTQGYDTNVQEVAGVDQWKADLAPGMKTEIKLAWRLSWPQNANVTGVEGLSVGVMGAVDRF